jgi:hypothetical protein
VGFPVFGVFHPFKEVIPGAEDGNRLRALPDWGVLSGKGQENKRAETDDGENDADSGFFVHGVFLSYIARIFRLDSARRYLFHPVEVKALQAL